MRQFINTVALLESPDFKTTTRVYRGTKRSNPDAFQDTRLGKPTFTDVFGIAYAYAEGSAVFAYDIAPHNPLVFNNDDPFLDVGEIIERIDLKGADIEGLITSLGSIRYSTDEDPEDVSWLHLKTMSDAEREDIIDRSYTEAFKFFDSTFVQDRAAAAGYDCMIYRGWFTSGEPEYLQPGDSWDGDTALEWRPLIPAIVKLVGEATPDDLKKAA